MRPARVAICPCPPLLLPDSGGESARDDLGELRARAQAVIGWLLAAGEPVLVLHSGEPGLLRQGSIVSASAFGLAYRGALGVATSDAAPTVTPRDPGVLVASHLLAGHPAHALGVADLDVAVAEAQALRPAAVLVMGGGSARRRDGAPGYLDERAVPYDDTLAAQIGRGDIAALADPDLGVADHLLADLPRPLAVAARLCTGGNLTAALDHYDAPYGVANIVARWSLDD